MPHKRIVFANLLMPWVYFREGLIHQFEARFHFGSGYRVYFAIEDKTIILLLLGGDKKSQSADIKKAKQNLRQYLESE